MSAFRFIKGYYLWLLIVAIILHVLLAVFAPDPNGYVWDFYSEAIILTYDHGRLPTADECWICYHPPMLPILGTAIFHLVDLFNGSQNAQLFAVAMFLNLSSLVFAIYCFAIYLQYRRHSQLDLVIWGLVLFLPLRFINGFSIESDMLVSMFIAMSLYYFIAFLQQQQIISLILASLFIALACLTKYSGIIIAFFLGMVLLLRYFQGFEKAKLKQGVTFALIVFLIGGFPYVNNLIETGFPIVGNKAWNTDRTYTYNYKDFSIPRIIEVFTDPREAKLKFYYQYNSEVLNSHYGQLWTDMSFFSRAYRHGQYEVKFIYENKYVPVSLLWAILISGLVPVISGIAGFFMLFTEKNKYFLIGFFILSAAVYVNWFTGHNYWMLKAKYLLYLLPVWLVSIDQMGRLIKPVILQKLLLPSVIFSLIYSFFFAVF